MVVVREREEYCSAGCLEDQPDLCLEILGAPSVIYIDLVQQTGPKEYLIFQVHV